MSHVPPATIVDDETLRINAIHNRSDRLVVVFNGIGMGMGGLPADEFVGTAIAQGRAAAMFISDKTRSWYSVAGLPGRIISAVRDVAESTGASRVFAIGNSMGGYGALRFAGDIGAETAVALVPQVSMDRDVIDERRWAKFRAGFGPELLGSVAEAISNGPQYYAIFGGAEPRDMAQAALLPERANLKRLDIDLAGHWVARLIKEAGVARPMIEAMFERDEPGIQRVMSVLADKRTAEAAARIREALKNGRR